MHEPPNSYEPIADWFAGARDPGMGVREVLDWACGIPERGAILDLGCGHGVPIGRALAQAGYRVHGIDASPALVAAFRANVPGATADVARIESFDVPRTPVDGVVAWGVLFLLTPAQQEAAIARAAAALRGAPFRDARRASGAGRLLFTSPREPVAWTDTMNGVTFPCVSLGLERYGRLLQQNGLALVRAYADAAQNHYVEATLDA
jgi:SAM-dependent methyltransferase